MWLLSLVVVVVLLVALLHVVIPKKYKWPSTWRKINKIPGPRGLPYLGNTLSLLVSNEELIPTLSKLTEQYGPTWRISILGHILVFLTDLDDVEAILNSRNHITKGEQYNFLVPWLGTGLLISTGKKWFDHRKWLTPAFHFTILEQYVGIINKNANILVGILESYSDSDYVEINPLISHCSLDIICETAMGIKVNAQLGGEKDYVKSIISMSQIFTKRSLRPWLFRPFIFNISPLGREHNKHLKIVHDFTEKVIRQRRSVYRKNQSQKDSEGAFNSDSVGEKKKISFLDLLIEISETQKHLTEEEIREEVDTFMFEVLDQGCQTQRHWRAERLITVGHDTTASALTWTLFTLGLHPDVQERAYEEQKEIFKDTSKELSFANLQEMKYLERVIKETLRLFPSVPLISRTLEENVKIGDYELLEGTQVPLFVYHIHRNPNIYPEPEKFNPDRFLPELLRDRHPYSYIPFSAGPRNCIGQKFAMMEEKIVLSHVIRNFKITSIDSYDSVKVTGDIILRPKENLKLKFTRRGKMER